MASLVAIAPPRGAVHRVARGPAEPFSPPDWERAHDDGTFGNRFDDPSAVEGKPPAERFRVLYCATQREGAFGETLARFRPSVSLLAQLESIDDDESLAESLAGAIDPDVPRRGLIPADWRLRRRIQHTILDADARFIDITAGKSIQHLRAALASIADKLRISDIDLSSLTSQQRRFTQACARYIYEQLGEAGGGPAFAGIRYLSRLNSAWECWAIFEDRLRPAPGYPSFPESILADDPDLISVAAMFNLTVEIMSGKQLRPK